MLSRPPQKSEPCTLVLATFHYVLLCTFKNAIVSQHISQKVMNIANFGPE